jgi:hypothetical protein
VPLGKLDYLRGAASPARVAPIGAGDGCDRCSRGGRQSGGMMTRVRVRGVF